MIFKDLINIVNYDDVWVELRKGYKLKKSAYGLTPGEIISDVFGIIRINEKRI